MDHYWLLCFPGAVVPAFFLVGFAAEVFLSFWRGGLGLPADFAAFFFLTAPFAIFFVDDFALLTFLLAFVFFVRPIFSFVTAFFFETALFLATVTFFVAAVFVTGFFLAALFLFCSTLPPRPRFPESTISIWTSLQHFDWR